MLSIQRALAALALAATSFAALAAGLTAQQFEALKPGMSEEQVQQLLGKAPRNVPTGGTLGGRTWIYPMEGSSLANGTIVEVDFGPEGRLRKVTQRFVQDFH